MWNLALTVAAFLVLWTIATRASTAVVPAFLAVALAKALDTEAGRAAFHPVFAFPATTATAIISAILDAALRVALDTEAGRAAFHSVFAFSTATAAAIISTVFDPARRLAGGGGTVLVNASPDSIFVLMAQKSFGAHAVVASQGAGSPLQANADVVKRKRTVI